MGRYITGDELDTRMGHDAYLRVFDKDRDGIADATIVDGAIALVETWIDVRLAASHATPFTDTIPPHIKDIACMLAPHAATMFYTGASAGAQGPYKALWDGADKALDALAKDRGARLPTQTAEPVASVASAVEPAPTPFADAAAGPCDPSGRGSSSGF